MLIVSVILPNYNHASFLEKRIKSILDQTYKNFELIILDDCSKDSSREIIEQYRQHPFVTNIIYNSINSGSTFTQWKKGVELAKGDYIWFAESDDFAEPDFLEKLIPLFKVADNVGLVFCNSHIVDANGNITGTTNNWGGNQILKNKTTIFDGYTFCKEHLFLLNRIPNASAVIFKRILVTNNLNWIDDKLLNAGDWKLWINIALNSNIVRLNESLNYFRKHNANVTKSLPLQKSESLIILKELAHAKKTKKLYRVYESLAFWSFNSAAWIADPKYTKGNFKLYFNGNFSITSIFYLGCYFVKHWLLSIKSNLFKK